MPGRNSRGSVSAWRLFISHTILLHFGYHATEGKKIHARDHRVRTLTPSRRTREGPEEVGMWMLGIFHIILEALEHHWRRF
ncbi:hypothetical protein DFH11DRAFT_1637441 [Phellopilus nigrolimitatus]|nr:hypothetical protein DFH11DRAFT_1637441 [Phellopilus nigrolimitatus]